VITVAANVLLAVIKGLAGVLGHSYALIADAVDSITDVFKMLIILGGVAIASAPPDQDHPYGHGKAEPLAAIVIAAGLIATALGLAIQSVREIAHPQHAPAPFTLVVLVLVVIVKELLFRQMRRAGETIQSAALHAGAWEQRSDMLTSTAAGIGILIALVGGERYASADDYAALIACAVIAYNGVCLIRPALAELMDAVPSPEVEAGIRRAAAALDGVVGLDECNVRKMGADFFVDLHILVDGAMTVRAGHALAHRVKDAVRTGNPSVRDVLIHVEPAATMVDTEPGSSPKE